MSDKPYRFIAEEPPSNVGRPKTTIYKDILDDFMATEMESARIELPDKAVATLYQQLQKTAKADKYPLKVRKLGEAVWLVRDA